MRNAVLGFIVVSTVWACGPLPHTYDGAHGGGTASSTTTSSARMANPDGVCEGKVCVDACEQGGRAEDCMTAGKLLWGGEGGVSQDETKALSAFEKSCAAKNPDACMRLASVYKQGEAKSGKNITKAASALERACKAGEGSACVDAGVLYRDGADGLTANFDKAESVFQDSCKAKNRDACLRLGELYEVYSPGGARKPVDAKRAHTAYMQSCDMGHGEACKRAGDMFEQGTLGSKDRAQAVQTWGKGCSSSVSHQESCTQFKQQLDKGDKTAAGIQAGWKKACGPDKSDKKALGAWMDSEFNKKMKRGGKNQTCATCHGEPFVPEFIENWKKK